MGLLRLPKINFKRDGYSRFQYKIIANKFDRAHYITKYPEVARLAKGDSNFDPVKHYMQHGVAAGYDPHPEFSTSYYIQLNPDVVAANQNPFFHYIMYGAEEGRRPKHGKEFIALSGEIVRGQTDSSTAFTDAGGEIYDYIKGEFDADYYKSKYNDIEAHCEINPGFDCVHHYIECGAAEGRDPSRVFSTQHYLEVNSDVRNASINPFYHFVKHGQTEGRTGNHALLRKYMPLDVSPRVLFVSHSGHIAGAEVMFKDMLQWLSSRTAYVIDILVLEYGPLCQEFQKYGRVITLNGSEDAGFFATTEFARNKYDYIYCNSVAAAWFGSIYEMHYKGERTPLILHVHEMKDTISKFKADLQKIDDKVSFYIAASKRVKSDLANFYNIGLDKIKVFESFIDITATKLSEVTNFRSAAREEFNVSDEDFLIIGSGTVYDRKGPDTFVKTLQLLSKMNASVRVIGIWIGDGPDYHALRHWIAQSGDESTIRFVGFKQNARQLIAAGDLFFLSSREDPFPLVCLEAAQYAIPIAYFGGCSGIDAFVAGDAGVEIPTYDENAAARTLQFLISNPDTRSEMGLAARTKVIKHNSQTSVMTRIFRHINDALHIQPTLSVIVPNFNHERFVGERIQSVLNQGFEDIEIIVLDDASTDHSIDVINRYVSSNSNITLHTNLRCSGSPFKQWRKGLDISRGVLVWIAESDDSCSNNFLSCVLNGFAKNGVNISYARTVNIDEFGNKNEEYINKYLAKVSAHKFRSDYFCSGYSEVEQAMAVACTIVNASGAIMRKSALLDAIQLADDFKMCGDWIIYLAMLREGSICYNVEAENYFRRHSSSVVSRLEGTDIYFEERSRIARYVVENFGVSDRTINKMIINLEEEWARFRHIEKSMTIADLLSFCDSGRTASAKTRKRSTIALYIHGLMFSKGGIENQGVELANHLYRTGHNVVVFCAQSRSEDPVFELDHGIHILRCFDEANIDYSKKIIRRKLVEHGADLFIVMLSEWLFEPVVSAAQGLKLKIIASEHNDPWIIQDKWWTPEGRETTFRNVDYVHLLTPQYRSSVPYLSDQKIRVIPNGTKYRPEVSVKKEIRRRVIAVGRLVEQKNFSVLIRAFAKASGFVQGWELDVFGDGRERKSLQHIIDEHYMGKTVHLKGVSDSLHDEMLKADFIVIPSLFEGYPVVALEAKMAGLPIVAYEGCNGMRELVEDGVTGFLCKADRFNDVSGSHLANDILSAMNMGDDLLKMSARIIADAEAFSFKAVHREWDVFLADVLE